MTSTQNEKHLADDLIERLRDIHPIGPGPTSFPTALRLARLQAERVSALTSDLLSAPQLLALVSDVDVRIDSELPAPSASQFNEHTGQWQILVCGRETVEQQSFVLLQEFKRILDSRDAAILYDPAAPIGDVQQELAASYFARVALMPEKDVRRAVEHGVRELETLAAMFEVTIAVARMRVSDLNLTDRIHTD